MKPRLLVVELHHLGDAVLSLPFIRGASRTHEVHVLCRPATRGIYELLSCPPKVHAWEPPWAGGQDCSASAAISAARVEGRVLRPLEFDAAVCVWADTRAELVMAETRARRRVGFPMTRENHYATEIPWRRHADSPAACSKCCGLHCRGIPLSSPSHCNARHRANRTSVAGSRSRAPSA